MINFDVNKSVKIFRTLGVPIGVHSILIKTKEVAFYRNLEKVLLLKSENQ